MKKVHPFLTQTDLNEITHNGAFQKAQPSGSFGATSTKTFQQRQQAERNRRVASYQHSKIVLDQYSSRELYELHKPNPRQAVRPKPEPAVIKDSQKSTADIKERFNNIKQSGGINRQVSPSTRPSQNFYSGIRPEIGR